MTNNNHLQKVRRLILFFMIMLALSGITAFPIETELRFLLTHFPSMPAQLREWIAEVYEGVRNTNMQYPFLQYGYDWLAFAHLMIALMFIGPYKDPVRNIWVIEWGMIACICILPLALICGPLRGIPLFWQIIDCLFGVLGIVPLYICRKWIKQIEAEKH